MKKLLIIILLLIPIIAYAESVRVTRVKTDNSTLEQRIVDLEKRVEKLEKK